MLSLSAISKRFGSVSAVVDVSLTCAAGHVHGLLGENGAGKSTLMNILFGLVTPDAGSIALAGKSVRVFSPHQAQRLGIAMVHQHFALVPILSVVDNIILALDDKLGFADRAKWSQRLRQRAASLHWDINPLAVVGTLAIGQQQRVEILKALLGLDQASNVGAVAKILILDEPTAVLTEQEVDELLPAIRRLASDGVAVLYISHKLDEVARVCDVVTVLRRGRVVHHGTANTPPAQLAALMIGAAIEKPQRTASPAPDSAMSPVIIKNLCLCTTNGRVELDNINLNIRAGEIVAIAGVEGNGQSALVEVLLGQRVPTSGSVHGVGSPTQLGYIPDDRHRDALVLSLSLRDNLVLKQYRSLPFSWHGWLSLRQWTVAAKRLISAYDVRALNVFVPVVTLSGGNQQKAVIARELSSQPSIIIAVNPTRGLDIAAATSVLKRLIAARDAGAAVLLIHHDLDEIMSITDRLLVMHEGQLTDTNWPASNRAQISQLMLGHVAGAAT